MNGRGAVLLTLACLSAVASVSVSEAGSEDPPTTPAKPKLVVERGAPVAPFVFKGDVRALPQVDAWRPGDPIKKKAKEIEQDSDAKLGTVGLPPLPASPDRLLELQQRSAMQKMEDAGFTTPSRNRVGQEFAGAYPPDTVGDVGPNHYIQMVNSFAGSQVAIYDKAAPTPTLLAGPFLLEGLGQGPCTDGIGDPVVIYDRFADRWLLAEFSAPPNYRLCVYISTTSDPVAGGWTNYPFEFAVDYPKIAVWPTDANGGAGSYVVTYAGTTLSGIAALDRGKMLAQLPTTDQRVFVENLGAFNSRGVISADVDGPTPPPTGAPTIIARHHDTEYQGEPPNPVDLLDLWAFDVDWTEISNTTLTQLPSINVSEFDSHLCANPTQCIPQPGTSTQLDTLHGHIMFRLPYVNFGDHQSIVGNFVTDVDGTDHAGVRWFELRGDGTSWSLYQEGTYAIDGHHRWLGSIAMDGEGNIALGYNVASSSVHPGLRYTGRLVTDLPGVMSQPETVIRAGDRSSSISRYGDYAAMSVDPSDDCTFWFTGEWSTCLPTCPPGPNGYWSTAIASFKFDACDGIPPPPPGTIEAGYGHSVALFGDGTAWGLGLNASGQLGDGTTTNRNGPVRAGSLTGVVALAAGTAHTVALLGDGTVWAWGANSEGQLGDGTTVPRSTPGQVPGLTDVAKIVAGSHHTLAIKTDGTVWAWGDNGQGQLGDGTTVDRAAPVRSGTLTGIVSVGAGFLHSAAVKGDGTVWTWGGNGTGQLGDGSHVSRNAPGIVPGLTGVAGIACDGFFNVALLHNRTLMGWGHNFYGQLGDGTTAERSVPVSVSGLSGVVGINVGAGFSLAVRVDGTVWSWGQNVAGQLGDGTTNNRSLPGLVSGLPAIVAVAGGEDHSLARATDGRIFGWGNNLHGELGTSPNPQLTPVLITDTSSPPDVIPPDAPALSGDAGRTTIAVTWTAPGDDGGTGGPAQAYDLRFSTQPINAGNFALATSVAVGAPGDPGTPQCALLENLQKCKVYYVALRVLDDAGNQSSLSTSGQIRTDCSGSQVAFCD